MNLIQGLDGDVVDVTRTNAEELNRIAEDLSSRLRGDQGLIGRDGHNWFSQELDIIKEELEARARDERIGL